MMAKKEKEKYVELQGLFGDAADYHVYHMTKIDYLAAYMLGFGVGLVVIYAFFRNIIVMLIGVIVFALLVQPYYN